MTGSEEELPPIDQNEAIRRALSASAPNVAGKLVVKESYVVEDGRGNLRWVDFIGPEDTSQE